jgi:AraC-like DNA-binding protein
MNKVVFSTHELPGGLDDRSRFKLWRDLHAERFGEADMAYSEDRPFYARFELIPFGKAVVTRMGGTLDRYDRTARQIAAHPRDDILISFLTDGCRWSTIQRGREVVSGPGQIGVSTNASPMVGHVENNLSGVGLGIPRTELAQRVPHLDDLMPGLIDPTSPAARHLVRYVGTLCDPHVFEDDPLLVSHVENTLVDLVALALTAGRDTAQFARMRGLRAAHVHAIVVAIKAGYAQAAISPASVAQKVGLSPRYLHELLQETGMTFSERVRELRLQKAQGMLATARFDRLKVSDIAYACGFSDVSYFNRCFRRRFGCSPRELRANNAG